MRISIILLLVSVFLNVHVTSQQPITIWDKEIASKKMKKAGMIAFVAENNTNGLSVIICPGGSYRHLAMDKEGIRIAEWLQKSGITTFVLRYRVGLQNNRHPAMIQDLQRAIQFVKENHSTYRIDTCKIGIMGFSAGGHLAGTAATYYQINFMEDLGISTNVSLRPDFVAMIYPVVSMVENYTHKKSKRYLLGKNYAPEVEFMLSLEKNVHSDMPPVFMIHCTKDKTVDYRNASDYNNALTQIGVPCEFISYDERKHGFGINPNSSHASSWINHFIPWLRKIKMINEEQ